MRFFLDGSFPAGAEVRGSKTVRLERWKDLVHRTDSEVVEAASRAGFDAVVVMGRDNLASTALLGTARQVKIGLVVTHSDEPVAATDALAERLDGVAAEVGPGRVVLVLSSEVRSWPAKELLEGPDRP